MPSEENNGYVFPILNGISTFMQGAVAVFKKAGEWYRDNEETIRNFIISFSNFSTCCSAIEKMAQRQIMFSDDISNIYPCSSIYAYELPYSSRYATCLSVTVISIVFGNILFTFTSST